MKLRTLISLVKAGQLSLLRHTISATTHYQRLAFIASALSNGVFRALGDGSLNLAALAKELGFDPETHDALRAWLDVGVALGELSCSSEGYALHSRLSRKLIDPSNDSLCAFVQEVATLHGTIILQTPTRVRQGSYFSLAEQDGELVARSSRVMQPFICEAMDAVIPRQGPVRLLEIGCGAGAYIRHAASRNGELTARALELQPSVAALAARNMSEWGLSARVVVEVGDILHQASQATFDVATLHQNIYYFPVSDRPRVFEHVRSFLKPGGRLLATTLCQAPRPSTAVLNLWASVTAGCGRLPAVSEMEAQLKQAGFNDVVSTSLIPRERFYAFTARNRPVS